jgi:hypothetical protein
MRSLLRACRREDARRVKREKKAKKAAETEWVERVKGEQDPDGLIAPSASGSNRKETPACGTSTRPSSSPIQRVAPQTIAHPLTLNQRPKSFKEKENTKPHSLANTPNAALAHHGHALPGLLPARADDDAVGSIQSDEAVNGVVDAAGDEFED